MTTAPPSPSSPPSTTARFTSPENAPDLIPALHTSSVFHVACRCSQTLPTFPRHHFTHALQRALRSPGLLHLGPGMCTWTHVLSQPSPAPPSASDLTYKTKSNSLHAMLWLPSRQGLSCHGSVWGGKALGFRVSPRENRGSPTWQQPPCRPGPGLDLVQHHSPASGPCPLSILSTFFLSSDQNHHLGQSSS